VRVVLYTGKGGVGKTTTAAATAVHAARSGCSTLVASADAAHSLGDVLERRLGPSPTRLAPNLDALEVDTPSETHRHWGAVRDYLIALFRYQGIEEVVAEELALLPGAEEITTLLAVEAHARDGGYDFVVVDCAPTDSALRLLTLPEVARGAFRVLLRVQRALASVVTPLARNLVPVPLPESEVFRDAESLLFRKLRRLRDFASDRCTSVRLVLTPERMVIDEALRAHTDLALFELACDAVVMNRLLPEAAAEEEFFRDWVRVQVDRLAEVEELFAPLPVLTAPLQDDEVTGLDRLARHASQLFDGVEPDAVLSTAPRIRFAAESGGYRVEIPLPHASAGQLEVAKIDDQLVIETGTRRRSLPLPRRIANLEFSRATQREGVLVAHLTIPPGSGA
jgi:arsenite-transporting ATPase